MGLDHYPGNRRIGYPKDPLDSFGRTRIAMPFNVFDAQFNYDTQPSLFHQLVIGGSVSHVPSRSAIRLSTDGTTLGNKAVFQSKQYFRYQPGKAHNIMWTSVLGIAETNVRTIIGLYDEEDGLAFILSELGIGVLRRTSTSGVPVDTITLQADWNLDTLDGSRNNKNPSGMNLDTNKNNIFVIDMQWLGAGRVRYGFDFSGHITYVHQIQWANTSLLPYMRTGNLPFRVEIENIGIATNVAAIDFTCVIINSGGGSKPFGLMRSTNNAEATDGSTPLRNVSSGNQPLPVISIRPRTTFNSLINRGLVLPSQYQIISKTASIVYSLILNGSLTGASFADVDTENSIVEVDVVATAISGGVVIKSGYVGGAAMEEFALAEITLSNNIAGDGTDVLSVVISLAGGTGSDCAGAFTWKEER